MQIREIREHLGEKLRAQALKLQRLEERLRELRAEHGQLEAEARDQFEALVNPGFASQSTPLAEILTAVQNLRAATLPRQLFNILAEESHRLGARAVIFEVRDDAPVGGRRAGILGNSE